MREGGGGRGRSLKLQALLHLANAVALNNIVVILKREIALN